MRFGTICTWRNDLDSYLDEVQLAERLGFELIGTGDSQSLTRDVYVALALAARATQSSLLGPMCTNPVTRHVAVTANAIATVDRVSNGRAILGIGSGDSALRNIGERPARVSEMASYIQTLRTLFTSGEASHAGRHVSVQGLRRAVPLWITAEGPRTLRLAGMLADAVVLHCGTTAETLQWTMAQLRAGAEQAGRDVEKIQIWMMLKTSVADTRAEALEPIRMGLAASAHHAYRHSIESKGIPAELVGAVKELIRQYDTGQHEVAGGRNSELSDRLGLTDFLADAFGLIGTPAECGEKLAALEQLGVQGVILPALGPDPIGLLERLGRDVLPRLQSSVP